MSYISFSFFFFVAALLLLYYLMPLKARPYILLAGSLYFYIQSGWGNTLWLLTLIAITYIAARVIEAVPKTRKLLLTGFLIATIVSLIFVKFINYFLSLSTTLFSTAALTLDVLVPLGLSFFTLQAIGYVIDVYRGKYPAERNPFKVALFLSFFPLVVQGPISRMNQLGSSLFSGHKFDYNRFMSGLQLSFWGLFLKLVIANRAANFADPIFASYDGYTGLSIVLTVLLYTLQIYTDFAGCVNICRGISQMFGVDLMENFDHPYFATSIKDFWRRWHISLSSWLRDYVYISLGGNRKGTVRKYVNLVATFIVSGIWHGVGIHYLVWGVYHGALQIAGELTKPLRQRVVKALKVNTDTFSYRLGQQLITFGLVAYGWLLFRASGLIAALKMTKRIFLDFINLDQLDALFFSRWDLFILFVATLVLWGVSTLQTRMKLREKIAQQSLWFRWTLYLLLFFAVVIFGVYGNAYSASDFLYMQF